MTASFISCLDTLQELLPIIVRSSSLHGKWLNTLSYLENCGARKIAACEHPTLVKEEMLKHASEEFRHAHYLKKQIERICDTSLEDYSICHLLGGWASVNYLKSLDLMVSRFLLHVVALPIASVREYAYLLVTYAIEVRADELYRIYDEVLRKERSKVVVKSILLEEKEHLNEMREGIKKLPHGEMWAKKASIFEGILCQKWLLSVARHCHVAICPT